MGSWPNAVAMEEGMAMESTNQWLRRNIAVCRSLHNYRKFSSELSVHFLLLVMP